jgi:hypothetical protein
LAGIERRFNDLAATARNVSYDQLTVDNEQLTNDRRGIINVTPATGTLEAQ